MEYIQINGARVSRIALGTWAIGGNERGTVDQQQAIDQIVRENVKDPIGPEYLKPELRQQRRAIRNTF